MPGFEQRQEIVNRLVGCCAVTRHRAHNWIKPMASDHQLISEIITDTLELQADADRARRRENGPIRLPIMIPAPDHRTIEITPNSAEKIWLLGERRLDNLAIRNTVNASDWHRIVQRAFGYALSEMDCRSSLSDQVKLVRDVFKREIEQRLEFSRQALCHHFGCTFIQEKHFSRITIGPSKIRERREWLDEARSSGDLSESVYQHVLAHWEGTPAIPAMTVTEEREAKPVIAAVGSAAFVCSVTTEGITQDMSKEKALLAARLTLATLALVWDQPSRALEGMNLNADGPSFTSVSLFSAGSTGLLDGWKREQLPSAPGFVNQTWEQASEQYRPLFAVAGEALDVYTGRLTVGGRPKTSKTIFHAIMWFHDACRERVALLAVVKFAATLEILSGSESTHAICSAIEKHLGLKKNAPLIRNYDKSVGSIVERIYSIGRSRTLHGKNDKFTEDWEFWRRISEMLARLLLIKFLEWSVHHRDEDDPDGFSHRQR